MKRRVHTIWAILTSMMTALTGCRPQQPFYLHESGDLSHYIDVASDIEYPDVQTTTLAEVEQALPPYTLSNTKFASYWDLTLEEAIKNSLANSKVMKSLGGRYVSSAFNNRAQTGDAPDAITTGADFARTVYDPAIIETTPFQGVEYALSSFDAQLQTSLSYNKNDHPQNILPIAPLNTTFFKNVFQENTSTFNSQLTKITAEGGQFSVSNNVTYDNNNNPTRQFPQDWNSNFQVQFNQPLLAGAGAQFNRIAGPYNPFVFIPGGAQLSPAFDGVLLARINVDIGLADFEGGVRNLVSDTENAYWELAFSWRNLETSNTALKSARQTWKKIHLLYVVGSKGGEANQEAQARAQYFQFKGQTQTLLNELFRAENRLRYVMGLSATDGRLIRPNEKPTVAKVNFDWREITEEALARNIDLRRQKWRIKQQELQVIAAKNLLLPRLDVNGTYRWLGDGAQLFGGNPYNANLNSVSPTDPKTGLLAGSGSFATLGSGQFQEWQLGLQSTVSLGFRKELATLRYYQLNLAKERAKLQDEELEVSHQLADALRQMELNYELTETNFNRTLAADRQVAAVQAAYDAETVTLDQLLEAQRLQADAQTSYFRTLLDYQRAIIMVHYRKGSLLDYNNVYLAEGPWPAKAKFDAHRLARQRDASLYINYGFTRPSVISQGPVVQTTHGANLLNDGSEMSPMDGVPHEATAPEELPNPAMETVPSASGASPSAVSPKPGRLRSASASSRAFEWGPLGLNTDPTEEDSAGSGRHIANGLQPQSGWDRRQSPAASADHTTTSAGMSPKRSGTMQDADVQKVKHQEWTSASEHESFENPSPRPATGPAASGQGT